MFTPHAHHKFQKDGTGMGVTWCITSCWYTHPMMGTGYPFSTKGNTITCINTVGAKNKISATMVKDAYADYVKTGDSNKYILFLLLKKELGLLITSMGR